MTSAGADVLERQAEDDQHDECRDDQEEVGSRARSRVDPAPAPAREQAEPPPTTVAASAVPNPISQRDPAGVEHPGQDVLPELRRAERVARSTAPEIAPRSCSETP